MPKKIVNVYIEQGDYNYKMLFITLGYTVVSDFDTADLIVFTGGSDVSPHLYGDAAHRTTGNNTIRDAKEERLLMLLKIVVSLVSVSVVVLSS